MSLVLILSAPRWHSWIARLPPKEQVEGSNPSRGANLAGVCTGQMVYSCPDVMVAELSKHVVTLRVVLKNKFPLPFL